VARRNARYTPLDVDGPLPLEMIRGIPSIRRHPLSWLEQAVRRYGDLVAFPLPRTPVLLVNTPSGARRVLQENHHNYDKSTVQYGSLALVTGGGLLTADGELWRRHRRIMQPAFHHGGFDRIAEHTLVAAERLRRIWDDSPAGEPVDADAATMRAMLDVVGRTLFAADLAVQGERVVAAVEDALRVVLARAQSPLSNGPLGRVPSPSRGRLRRSVATLDEVCADLVARRRRIGIGAEDADVLALLLQAGVEDQPAVGDVRPAGPAGRPGGVLTDRLSHRADRLSDREIRDELVTLVIAGHETVASSLTWTLHLLAGDRQVQERLHAELDAVLGGRAPGWSDLAALSYTRAVVDESLRLYPPAWVISRRALGGDRLDGVDLPPGTLVLISPWLLHRRAQNWPEPLRFDPSRFLPHQRREGYLPFGAGPRLCIGRDFALLEAVLLVAALLRDRTVHRPRGARAPDVDALVTLRPRGGLPLLMTPRRH
jgi:cytochrome P450